MNQSSYFEAVDTKSPPAQFRIRLMAQEGDHSKPGCFSRDSSHSGHTETSASTAPSEGECRLRIRKTPAQPSEEKAAHRILATTRIELSRTTDAPTRTRLDRRQQPLKSSPAAESQTVAATPSRTSAKTGLNPAQTSSAAPFDPSPLSPAARPSLLSSPAAAHTQEVRSNGSTSPPAAWSPSFLTSDLLRHSDDQEEILGGQEEENLPQGRQLRFDPIVRIIPNPDEENSSDEEHPTRRNRSHPRKRPVRLCTKKIALPFNISTSSLIGIGYQNNHSNASLTHINPSGAVSSRELFAQTRKEIDEDEQFIPDAPRFLSLTLPSITRQPDRRALRLEEEHRLERWRQMGGGDKSNLKPINFHNLSHLSPALRDRLNNSTIPVQLSTNTAINSIPCSISPEDVLDKLDTHTIMPSKEPVSMNQDDDQLEILDTPHTLASSTSITSPPDNIPNSSVDRPSSSEVGVPSSLKLHALKSTRFGWLSDKVKSIRRRSDSQDPIKVPYLPIVDSTNDLPGTLLQKSPTPAWFNRPSAHNPPDPSLEGAPLKRVSTPRGLMSDTTTAGAPLHRTATPATSIRKPTGTPLQQSCNVGAPLIKMPTPGAALQRSGTSGAPLSKPRNVPFLKKLAIWRRKPPPSASTNSAPGFVNDPHDPSNTSHPDPLGRSTGNGSNDSLVQEADSNNMPNSTTDKWGSRKEVPLRECCKVCLNSANINVSQSPDTKFSTGALKHHYSKNWILQDTLRQGGIPSQQIKLISAELGPPYSSWVSKISTLNPGQNKLSQ